MIVTSATISAIRRTFSRAFQAGVQSATSEWQKIASRFPSGSAQSIYGWLMKFPQMRKWPKGAARQGQKIAERAYALPNEKWEDTIYVDRTDIEDDNLGVYRPLMEQMGQETRDHVDREVFGTLDAGERTICFDGKPF